MICPVCGEENRGTAKTCRHCYSALTNEAFAERNAAIYKAREEGHTFQEIANIFGVSRQRVYQVYEHQKAIRKCK